MTLTNSIGMKLVRIEPGEFLMGSPENEPGHGKDEVQHRVKITRPFRLGITHVTRGQFAAFVKDSGYQGNVSWTHPGFDQTDEHPVVNVSWNDATAFCQWLSKKESRRYRLPTEAEWEYACRAGTQTAYYFGDDAGRLTEFAWFADNSGSHTNVVGQKSPNAWGLYDMHGNACEWCGDWYGNYPADTATDPAGPMESTSRVLRVLRGGSGDVKPAYCRAAYRDGSAPDRRNYYIGFRVALDSQ